MDNNLHIRVDIEYKLNGEQLDHLKALAEKAIEYLLGNGLFTSETTAEITGWRCYVAPPRDKHVLVRGSFGEGYKVYGVFDGAEQAKAARCTPHEFVVRLQPITDGMRARMQEPANEQ